MPDKLTDSKIVKALECCKNILPNCPECPIKEQERIMCCDLVKEYALDLINRLQAENERLEYLNRANVSSAIGLRYELGEAKSEAYKEFAERLKEYATQGFWEENAYVGTDQIDNLLKELVGEDK